MCYATVFLLFLAPYVLAGGLTAHVVEMLVPQASQGCTPCVIGLFWPATLPILLLWAGGRGLTRWHRRRTFPRALVVKK